jgi:hypothetical protein
MKTTNIPLLADSETKPTLPLRDAIWHMIQCAEGVDCTLLNMEDDREAVIAVLLSAGEIDQFDLARGGQVLFDEYFGLSITPREVVHFVQTGVTRAIDMWENQD